MNSLPQRSHLSYSVSSHLTTGVGSHATSAELAHTNTIMTRVSSRGLRSPAAIQAAHDALILRAIVSTTSTTPASHVTSPGTSSTAFQRAVSQPATPTSTSLSHTPTDRGDPYQVPGTGHIVLDGYILGLIVVGIVFVLVGFIACCLKLVGRNRYGQKLSRRPVEAIAMSPLTYPQRPHRDPGQYCISADLEDQDGQELEYARRYQRQEAERAMSNTMADSYTYSYNNHERTVTRHSARKGGSELCWRCMKHQCGGEECPTHSMKGSESMAQSMVRSTEQAEVTRNRVYANLDLGRVHSGFGPQRREEVILPVPPPAYSLE